MKMQRRKTQRLGLIIGAVGCFTGLGCIFLALIEYPSTVRLFLFLTLALVCLFALWSIYHPKSLSLKYQIIFSVGVLTIVGILVGIDMGVPLLVVAVIMILIMLVALIYWLIYYFRKVA